MARYLLLDIGAGTLDMLCYDTDQHLHYKAVVRSPVRVLAEKIRKTRGNLVVTGVEMGGGPASRALIERAASATVVMAASAAATIHHDMRRVAAHGIRVVSSEDAGALKGQSGYTPIRTGDLQLERIAHLVAGMGLDFAFDAVGICAQDHGAAPAGVSHLDFRHRLFTRALEKTPTPRALLYRSDEIPAELNRLTGIAQDARSLPADRVYLMDSGMAAILGASRDVLATGRDRILVLDIATSHTVGAAMEEDVLCGFFEYHTKDVTASRLDKLLRDLPDGKLSHRQILNEGGHGAYSWKAFGYDQVQLILATGPRRGLAADSTLPLIFGAPWGDNMMTGTVGLLEAIRCRENLPPITYL
jgi:uncharacterized protein (DUF1786 family)